MSIVVREGKCDVAVVAGPRVSAWPSAGVRALSLLCAEMGLNVGLYGGETLTVRGVIPLPGTGGLVLAEDVQHRLHRIHARAVVRVSADPCLPDPFPGWRSQGLIPLSSAQSLRQESQVLWEPATVILGTGNRALHFGSELLDSGVRDVYCVETYAQWGAKRFAGWEVERRRFEMLGGKCLEAKPVSLSPKSPLLWELRLRDSHGIRVIEVARVVSAGPFRETPGVREYPPGSFLFELEQTAPANRVDDVEGWVIEEERGRWLAGKIVRALVSDLGENREPLDRVFRRAKGRLKRYFRHREIPFTPAYQGKWVSVSDARAMRGFRGVPQKEHFSRKVASVECFEEIPCNVCQTVCPESAIQIGRVPRLNEAILNESRCTGCGICLTACPSASIAMIHERENQSLSSLTLPWRGSRPWSVGEFPTLVNRRGDVLGSARVVGIEAEGALVQVEVPTHLLWEVRGLRKGKAPAATDEAYLAAVNRSASVAEKVEIILNGEKRLVRPGIPVSIALFEIGHGRPEDVLLCPDGSCGLCQVLVDGVKKLGCQTAIRRGMAVKLAEPAAPTLGENALCPCLGITLGQIVERLRQGKLSSPEAVLSALHVGEGKCHGQLCMASFRRVLLDSGLDVSQWVDWRFPWSEWVPAQN